MGHPHESSHAQSPETVRCVQEDLCHIDVPAPTKNFLCTTGVPARVLAGFDLTGVSSQWKECDNWNSGLPGKRYQIGRARSTDIVVFTPSGSVYSCSRWDPDDCVFLNSSIEQLVEVLYLLADQFCPEFDHLLHLEIPYRESVALFKDLATRFLAEVERVDPAYRDRVDGIWIEEADGFRSGVY